MVVSTYVYIDGLNFYYGAVKGTPNKWVDLAALARLLLPNDTIGLIRYCTANVKPRYPGDRSHERHAAYLRAVDADQLISIHRGHFRRDERWRPLVDRDSDDMFRPRLRPKWLIDLILADAAGRRTEAVTQAKVVITEEKGSDVNLGVHLVHDALRGFSTKAVLITNDGDLEEAIILATGTGIQVGIVNPHRSPTNARLRNAATFEVPFRRSAVGKCQLPDPVIQSNGKQVHKPKQW